MPLQERVAECFNMDLLIPDMDAHTRFLLGVHERHPGLTERSIGAARTAEGCSSYEAFCRFADPRPGMTVVDLACGNGPLCELLATRVGGRGQVIGVDLSEAELGLAADRLRGLSNVRLVRASASRLPLPDASADAVVCHMAFMLFTPLPLAVAEIGRVLKDGAVFAAVIPTLRKPSELFCACAGVLRSALQEDGHALDALSGNTARMGSIADLARIFSGGGWCVEDITTRDIDVALSFSPDTLAEWVAPAFYHYRLLSEESRQRVGAAWGRLFAGAADESDITRFSFPLSAFAVRKKEAC